MCQIDSFVFIYIFCQSREREQSRRTMTAEDKKNSILAYNFDLSISASLLIEKKIISISEIR